MVRNISIMAHYDAELEGGGDHLIGVRSPRTRSGAESMLLILLNSRFYPQGYKPERRGFIFVFHTYQRNMTQLGTIILGLSSS